MKALLDGKLIFATIVTPLAKADEFRDMFQAIGATLTLDKATANSEDNEHVFQTKDLKMSDLHLFDNNDKENSFIHYYEVQKGNYLVQFHSNDTPRREKHISGITIYYVSEDNKRRKIADIYSERSFEEIQPKDYLLNWGGWGSMDLETSKIFSEGIKLGVQLVEDCKKQFVK